MDLLIDIRYSAVQQFPILLRYPVGGSLILSPSGEGTYIFFATPLPEH